MRFSRIVFLLLMTWTAGQEFNGQSESLNGLESSKASQEVGVIPYFEPYPAKDVLHLGLKRCPGSGCCPLRLECCNNYDCCLGIRHAGFRRSCWK